MKIWFCFSILILACGAQAQSLSVPAVTSKIQNLGQLSAHSVQIRANIDCHYNYMGRPCGRVQHDITFDSTGVFKVPEMKLANNDWQNKSFHANIIFKIDTVDIEQSFSHAEDYITFLKNGVVILFTPITYKIEPKDGSSFETWFASLRQGAHESIAIDLWFQDPSDFGFHGATIDGTTNQPAPRNILYGVVKFGTKLNYAVKIWKYNETTNVTTPIYESPKIVDAMDFSGVVPVAP